jgi:uncharacterized protein (TIGR03790 family)
LRVFTFIALVLAASAVRAQTPDQVLVVENRQSADSREIGRYYMQKRAIPAANLCVVDTNPVEEIERKVFDDRIQKPVGACLTKSNLTEKILYIVTTKDVPLKIAGKDAGTLQTDEASVDSELTLLYQVLHGKTVVLPGAVPNPFFRQRDTPFRHPLFPMYLVARLSAYDMEDMKAMIDRALVARNDGVFVVDAKPFDTTEGDDWLRTAALLLPKGRVVMDDSATVLKNEKNVIGYASWGSNDQARKERLLHFEWRPGAIATEFVSTDGRTFRRPPDSWQITTWENQAGFFAGSPQSLAADYIHEGASGASGQVYEPFLRYCPRPDFVLPAYYSGRTLAESFYMGIPGLSWMNIVIGDPLMRLKP